MANHGLNAYMNHGRWLIHCPRCASALPAEEQGIVCPVCWPGIRAKAFTQLPNGLLRPVADREIVEATRAKADAQGEVWKPVWPADKAEIEDILRRRKIQHMNWEPGETLEFLLAESVEHGDPVPPPKKKGRK